MPSASGANGIAAAGSGPKKWQFININEPKKTQDKGVISIVRAHAMRSVRRNQRLKIIAQHQKTRRIKAPEFDRADSSVTAEQSVQIKSNDWLIGDEADIVGPMMVCNMLSEPELITLGLPATRNEAEISAEHDEYSQWSEYWQRYGEDEMRATKLLSLGTCRNESPKSLVGDGVFDPFNALPIAGYSKYTSHVLNHFASVMALNCLPVDQPKGQNPLTKTWLPYALQDSTLFLATLTFAATHLEILSGNYKSPRTLLHKSHSIQAVNAKLGDREHALSNETIGAVAMLAAMESILGNYRELRVHINGLQRMVYMRGGIQNLGWGGVLHMFISWQELLSSSMMAGAPTYEQTPCCLLIRGSLRYSNPIFPELGLSTELCGEIATAFQDMRYLSQTLTNWVKSQTTLEITFLSEMRDNIAHRLLSFANQKSSLEMTNLDYHIELCRLAALIYIEVALHTYSPLSSTILSLKVQLIDLIKQGEASCKIGVSNRPQPSSITWALFVSGILSINKEEEEWFAQRLAKGIRASGVETWAELQERLKHICWAEVLNTSTCQRLWRRVESIHAEYWAAQVRSVASDWDRRGSFYWYPDPKSRNYSSLGTNSGVAGDSNARPLELGSDEVSMQQGSMLTTMFDVWSSPHPPYL